MTAGRHRAGHLGGAEIPAAQVIHAHRDALRADRAYDDGPGAPLTRELADFGWSSFATPEDPS